MISYFKLTDSPILRIGLGRVMGLDKFVSFRGRILVFRNSKVSPTLSSSSLGFDSFINSVELFAACG